jgi:putative heme-binding domain-containing protein
MTRKRPMLLPTLVFAIAGGLLLRAQEERSLTLPPGKNPHLANKESIRAGMVIFRTRCADCHGLDASGYRGPDLVAAIAGGVTDERLFQTIRKGVPGTEMPSNNSPDDELLQLIAYLHSVGTTAPSERASGNAENGAKLFASQCASCHRVAGRGGRIGPDLSRIGIARSPAALIREIRTPSEWIEPNYEAVTLVTKDGQRIRGAKKNEDVFSIQVMDMRERIQGYLKSNLQDVVYEKASLMPEYGPGRLNDNDLNDLIGYLTTLRGSDVAVR